MCEGKGWEVSSERKVPEWVDNLLSISKGTLSEHRLFKMHTYNSGIF